jgi:hypothetical protein
MLLARGWNDLYVIHLEYRDVLETFLRNLGPVVFTVAACAVLARVTRETEGRPARALAPIAACLGVQLLFFAFPETDFYLDHCTRYRGDLRKAHELVHGDRDPSRPLPTVYSNLGCLDYVWLDLHSKSYFDWWQAGNYMFRREMAMEGRRRARLVAPLALERYRQMEGHLSQGHKDGVARFYEINFDRDPVGKDDLARVCREPGLDFLVLDVHIEGVNAVPAGSLYVYSCQEVRAALNLTVDSSAVRTASRRP